jgi:hypothetical protein
MAAAVVDYRDLNWEQMNRFQKQCVELSLALQPPMTFQNRMEALNRAFLLVSEDPASFAAAMNAQTVELMLHVLFVCNSSVDRSAALVYQILAAAFTVRPELIIEISARAYDSLFIRMRRLFPFDWATPATGYACEILTIALNRADAATAASVVLRNLWILRELFDHLAQDPNREATMNFLRLVVRRAADFPDEQFLAFVASVHSGAPTPQ